jgi:hypothetical protein
MSDFALPVTCYAQSGDLNIDFQTMGNGPVDVILIPGFISHVEFTHEMIGYTSFLRRLSAFARADIGSPAHLKRCSVRFTVPSQRPQSSV